MEMILITTLTTSEEISSLLILQQENLRENVSIDEQISDGFLTLKHSADLLRRMNDAARTIIAQNSLSKVIGYALTMLPKFAPDIPELSSLFYWINHIDYLGKPLRNYSYYIMGQVCVSKAYRRQQIFQRMLYKHREIYKDQYQLLITSVSNKNQPSIRAHLGLGFEIIHTFNHSNPDENWQMLCWNWRR